jgi:hypothetical protein
MEAGAKADTDTRTCTCHPSERPIPCPRKFAFSDCWREAVYQETQRGIVTLKGRDRDPMEQLLLNYMMRVRTALGH